MRAAAVFLALLLALGAGILAGLWASDSGSASPGGSLSCVVKPSCTGSEVEVLRMSSTSNAHAGTPGGSGYGSVVCCGGVEGLGTSCTSGVYDTVLTLSAPTNAHVAAAGYSEEVCLSVEAGGAVDCTYAPSCSGDYVCLATISGTTNAHVADCAGAFPSGSKVCCEAVADPDRDGDGFWNDKETLYGSDPDDPASTPEVCDGVDNDLNDGIDEGYPDTNPGGDKDCLDPLVDTDGDTIPNPYDDDDDTWGPLPPPGPSPGPPFTGAGASVDCTVNDGTAKDCIDDAGEYHVGTDSLDACRDDEFDDAWPQDITNDAWVDVGDILMFRPVIMTTPGMVFWNVRYDLAWDDSIDVGDILMFKPVIMTQCTNP
jgi:hypothetical protein